MNLGLPQPTHRNSCQTAGIPHMKPNTESFGGGLMALPDAVV